MTLDFLKGETLLNFSAFGNVGVKIWFSIILNFKCNYLGLYYGLIYLLDLRFDISFLKTLKYIWITIVGNSLFGTLAPCF